MVGENMDSIFTMGIDVGSTASKCIVLKNGCEIVGQSLANAGAGTSGPRRAITAALESLSLTKEDLYYTVATGYGRRSIDWIDKEITELSAHAKGAYFFFSDVRTVIDIGGQDAKVLCVGDQGMLRNFVMNDKCAAGTGRFLEVMARILEVDLKDFPELAEQSTTTIGISSTCTVFAESEVISQLAKGTHKNDIIKGIHQSVASRVSGLTKRLGIINRVVMTGGVALNSGVRRALEDELNCEIYTSDLAQYSGALGAAIIGYDKVCQ